MRNSIFWATFILSFFLINPASITAQDLYRSGSTYSYYGLGMPNDYRGPHSGAMNVIGTSLFDARVSSSANPALLGTTRYTNINGGFNVTGYEIADGQSNASSTHIEGNQLQMTFPVYRDRLGVSAALLPETGYNYRIFDSGSLGADQTHSGEQLPFESEVTGTGGINRIELGAGYRVASRTYVGAAPSFYFGTLSQAVDVSFDDTDFQPVNFDRITNYTGWGGRLGFVQMIPGLLTQGDVLSVGASASVPVNLNAERRFETELDDGESVEIGESQESRDIQYPLDFSFGLTYMFSDNLRFSTDVLYQNWSAYEPFDAREGVAFVDRFRTGLGAEWSGYNANTPPSFFQDLIYRAGVSYDSGNLEINNQNINTLRASVGIAIPTSERSSSLNINFDYGMRGTQNDGLIQEEIYELRVSFNLSELMFFRPRLR